MTHHHASRPLGYWESALCLLHDNLAGTGIIFNALLLNGHIDLAALKLALRCLFDRHPLLRATISPAPIGFTFNINATFEHIEIRSVTPKHDHTWQQIIEQALKQPLQIGQSLWRVIALDDSTGHCQILLFFHHAIADGLSCGYFAHDLLQTYQQALTGSVSTQTSLPFLDPVETLLDRSTRPTIESADTTSTATPARPYCYQHTAPIAQRTTKSCYRVLSLATLQHLRQQCQIHQVKMNAVLSAAMLKTSRQMDNSQDCFDLLTPINLRPFCRPKVDTTHFGCYISCVNAEFDQIEQTDLWSLAQRCAQRLTVSLNALTSLPQVLDSENQQQLSRLLCIDDADTRMHFPAGYVVTNKGTLPFQQQYGPLTLTGYFTGSSRQAGDIVMNLSINTLLDQTFLTFTYTEPLIATAWAEQFADTYQAYLEAN